MRARVRGKIKKTEKITIYCEGATESSYIKNLLKEKNLYTPNISIEDLEGKGYKNFKTKIEKNRKINNIVLVICDLDRAANNKINEDKNLKILIQFLQEQNKKNNIFLSYPNFEYFVVSCLNCKKNDLDRLKYKKGNSVYKFIKKNNGSYDEGVKNIPDKYYYEKKTIDKEGVYYSENIDLEHSNLKYFIDYLKLILKK